MGTEDVWHSFGNDVVVLDFCHRSGGFSSNVPYTVRGAFEAFDETLAYAGQTLGLSNSYIFWRIRMPYCRQGVLAGAVLAFARALGEYGATSMIAGYTPGKTATVSTTVYQLWQISNDALALKWVLINIGISAIILLIVNMLEKKNRDVSGNKGRQHV